MWDLLLCHGKKHNNVFGTSKNTSIFVDLDPQTDPDFVLNLFDVRFNCKNPIFDRVFLMFCYANRQLIESEYFIESIANVLKSGGILLLPPNLFADNMWTKTTFKKIMLPFFYIKPIGHSKKFR
jgi:hypothetical protein